MPAFAITRRIHFGYMREVGIYQDLSDADCANLSTPRPGLPHGYGRVVHHAPHPEDTSHAANSHSAISGGSHLHPSPGGTEPHDPPPPPADPEPNPLVCPSGCRDGQPFATASALKAHRTQKQH